MANMPHVHLAVVYGCREKDKQRQKSTVMQATQMRHLFLELVSGSQERLSPMEASNESLQLWWNLQQRVSETRKDIVGHVMLPLSRLLLLLLVLSLSLSLATGNTLSPPKKEQRLFWYEKDIRKNRREKGDHDCKNKN